MKSTSLLITFCSAIFFAAGCQPSPRGGRQGGTQLLARAGSHYLTLQQAKAAIPDYALKKDSIPALKRYRKQWINRQLALMKARDLKLPQNKKVQQRLAEAHREVLLSALKDLILAKHKKKLSVTDSEAVNYYHRHETQFIFSERFIKFRQIGAADLSAARQARAALSNDSNWIEVAHKYSLKPDEMVKKSNRYWPVAALFKELPAMKRYASRLDSGQISPIRRSKGIYHFIQLTDVREKGEKADPGWFIKQLKEWRELEKQRIYYKTYLKKLYIKAKQDNEIQLFNVDSTRKK